MDKATLKNYGYTVMWLSTIGLAAFIMTTGTVAILVSPFIILGWVATGFMDVDVTWLNCFLLGLSIVAIITYIRGN